MAMSGLPDSRQPVPVMANLRRLQCLNEILFSDLRILDLQGFEPPALESLTSLRSPLTMRG